MGQFTAWVGAGARFASAQRQLAAAKAAAELLADGAYMLSIDQDTGGVLAVVPHDWTTDGGVAVHGNALIRVSGGLAAIAGSVGTGVHGAYLVSDGAYQRVEPDELPSSACWADADQDESLDCIGDELSSCSKALIRRNRAVLRDGYAEEVRLAL